MHQNVTLLGRDADVVERTRYTGNVKLGYKTAFNIHHVNICLMFFSAIDDKHVSGAQHKFCQQRGRIEVPEPHNS